MEEKTVELIEIGKRARKATLSLPSIPEERKETALRVVALALLEHTEEILKANALDMDRGRKQGMSEGLLDRLLLTEDRVRAMSEAILSISEMPSPVGEVLSKDVRPNGLEISKVRVSIGVVGIIYEARPNVTSDAFSLCFRSGNAVILKGGSDAIRSNIAITKVIREALKSAQVPEDALQLIADTDRETTKAFMQLNQYVDVLIPRGSKRLIQSVVEHASVPVLETGAGNCHIYLDETADIEKAVPIVFNAKTQRIGVCNACESLLVHRNALPLLPYVLEKLQEKDVYAYLCGESYSYLEEIAYGEAYGEAAHRQGIDAGNGENDRFEKYGEREAFISLYLAQEVKLEEKLGHKPVLRKELFGTATEEDFYTEYLDYQISVKVVEDVEEAIAHINEHSTKHSESILTEDQENAEKFFRSVDSACVYHNASTRFTDGGEFGFGAEIGISTSKLHARGPMGLRELTTTKYVIRGTGQVR